MSRDTTKLDDFIGSTQAPGGPDPTSAASGAPLEQVSGGFDESEFLSSVGLKAEPPSRGDDDAKSGSLAEIASRNWVPTLVMTILFVLITFKVLGLF